VKYILAGLWVTADTYFGCVVLVFGLGQIEKLVALNSSHALELARQQRMLFSEGLIFYRPIAFGRRGPLLSDAPGKDPQ